MSGTGASTECTGAVPSGNFLDIGCSFGGLMKAASRYYVPHGIELSPYAGSHAKELFGDRVHIGTLADHTFPERYFSVITMIELLEHLPDPAQALRECYRLLDENGLLVIQTANMDGLQARIYGPGYAYFMPGHISYFSRRNLVMALKGCGFDTIRVFYPVEFGLLPKLKKSRGSFMSIFDYLAWAGSRRTIVQAKFIFSILPSPARWLSMPSKDVSLPDRTFRKMLDP